MKLQYLGHSCVRIISQMGTAILCDPYDSDMLGFAMPKLSCDVVTISHHHADHDCIAEVKGNPAVLEKETYLAADDVAIQSIHSFHDDKKGALRGENYVFCFLVDGLKVVHMGDIGELSESLAQKLYNCDVLLLPVGGIFTVDSKGAKWYVDKIKPRIVIPIHYKTPLHKFDIAKVDDFVALFDKKDVSVLSAETFVLDDIPENEEPKVVVLQPYVE